MTVDINGKFSIYYDKDLLPLTNTETATVTATSGSIYNINPETR
jgi:hypothetical protein